MGHDTAHEEKRPVVVTKAAMYFALLIVGLLVATANFVQVMGHSDEGHGEAHTGASHEQAADHATAPEHQEAH